MVAAPNPACVTPLAFPLPDDEDALPTNVRGNAATTMSGTAQSAGMWRRSVDEMRELWAGTSEVTGEFPTAGPLSRLVLSVQRLRVLWSFWHWEKSDVLRASMIGMAVFAAVAAVGAVAVVPQSPPSTSASSAGPAAEVRVARTVVDQHTVRVGGVRRKGR
jgi:hypothetical protein